MLNKPMTREGKILASIAAIVIIALFMWWWLTPAKAASAQQLPACTVESSGLKYTQIEGSGIASLFFVIPLLAMAPLAGATDDTGQYGCHLRIIGADAAGARSYIRRDKVTPY